ncbi:MAG TPA: TraR/DksA C4-type zinc finger protein [Nocardioides sp.]|nr:TraR/DksA C4-type zinc finger protein [Nocardioides sp.]
MDQPGEDREREDREREDRARDRLVAERRRTLGRLADLAGDYDGVVAASRDTNADDEHDPEGATIAFERSALGALVRQARGRLEEVDAALRRVAEHTYGRCERCGQEVDPARLEARPEARTCIRCAAQAG